MDSKYTIVVDQYGMRDDDGWRKGIRMLQSWLQGMVANTISEPDLEVWRIEIEKVDTGMTCSYLLRFAGARPFEGHGAAPCIMFPSPVCDNDHNPAKLGRGLLTIITDQHGSAVPYIRPSNSNTSWLSKELRELLSVFSGSSLPQ